MTYKHRDIVIAYMDGAELQYATTSGAWIDMPKFDPSYGIAGFFREDTNYRIKPKPVLIRHGYLKASKTVTVYTKNFNAKEDRFSAGREADLDMEWLDDWHEAKFSAKEC